MKRMMTLMKKMKSIIKKKRQRISRQFAEKDEVSIRRIDLKC